jgi:DNA-binding NarL/FixJ family response regulator
MADAVTSEPKPRGAQPKEVRLSNRQREILVLVAEGATDSEIARQLCLSTKTVGWYVGEILARIDARCRAHAVALALQQGVLSGACQQDREP